MRTLALVAVAACADAPTTARFELTLQLLPAAVTGVRVDDVDVAVQYDGLSPQADHAFELARLPWKAARCQLLRAGSGHRAAILDA